MADNVALTPVDGNPFVSLTSVDGDPFQQNMALQDYARTLPNVAQPPIGQAGGAPLNDFAPAPVSPTAPQPAIPGLAGVAGDPSRSMAVRLPAAIGSSLADQGMGLAQSMWGAATLPGDVAKGLVDPSSPDAIRRSTDLAGLLTLPSVGAEANPDVLGAMSGARGYHATWDDFGNPDFSKLGEATLPNVEGSSIEPWAMNLAKSGFWSSATPEVAAKMGAPLTLPFDLSGEMKSYGSLDELETAISNAGGPEQFRRDMIDAGFSHAKVNDEEFGGTSYVTFDPNALRRTDLPPAPTPPSITAYHGSPHSFDQFDLSKIGTGEGAQAYGHGLYFAGNEDVAKGYRDTLSNRADNSDPNSIAFRYLNNAYDDRNIAIQDLRNDSGMRRRMGNADLADAIDSAADLLEAGHEPKPPGSMYQVAINADPDHFLDWDKPLSEQHPVVQDAIKQIAAAQPPDAPGPRRAGQHVLQSMVNSDATGGDIYGRLAYKQGAFPEIGVQDHQVATQKLIDAGVPGIKYLDAGSRNAGSGSRNYVSFSDKNIAILKKYGLAGLGIGAGGAALMGQNQPAQALGFSLTPVQGDPFAQ